jgi:2-aminoadipate transaminase
MMTDLEKEALKRSWDKRDPISYAAMRIQEVNAGTPTDWGLSNRQPNKAIERVSLAGGIPDVETLPRLALAQATARGLGLNPYNLETATEVSVLDDTPLSYGGASGSEPLRAEIGRFFARDYGSALGSERFLLTNGAAGAIELICSALLDPGDVVISEIPAFSGSLRTFRGYGARVVGVPMDQNGMEIDALEAALKKLDRAGTRVKLIYASPTFQNPTGTNMPIEHRQRLIQLAAYHGAILLEDTAYNEFYFGENLLPSLGSLADGHFVITVGTFSKVIAPGLRVGWLTTRPELLRLIVQARFDMGNSPLLHRTLYEMMASGELERHVTSMRTIYREKMLVLSNSLRELCGDSIIFENPEGGFFLWVKLLRPLKSQEVQERGLEAGVVFPVGSGFYLKDGPKEEGQHVRLAYSRASTKDLRVGAKRLASALV